MPLEAKDGEIMEMSIDFQGFQERAEGYKTLISNLCAEIDHLIEINIQQKEVIENQVEQIFNFHVEAEQAQSGHRERDKLLEKIHELDHVIKKNHILNKSLSLELQEALEKEDTLTKQKDAILKELEQLKMFLERKSTENNHLLVQVEELQEKNSILDIKNKMLSAEVSDLELLNERKDGEFGVLKKELLMLKHQATEPASEKTENDVGKVESLKQKLEIEVKSLGRNQELQEIDHFQNECSNAASMEQGGEQMMKLKSREEEEEEEEQYNFLQNKLLMVGKDELIAKQLQQIAHKKEQLDRLHIHNIRFRESLTEIKSHLMKKKEDVGPDIKAECGTQMTPHLAVRSASLPQRFGARVRAVATFVSKAATGLKVSCKCCYSSKNQVHPST